MLLYSRYPTSISSTNIVSFSFESFIARRYLRGAEGRSEGRKFLRLITYISVSGVAVGVCALILALSIVRGFSGEIKSKVIGFGAHVQIESMRDEPLSETESYAVDIAALSFVTSVSPVIQEFVLLRRSSSEIEGVSIWGTDKVPDYIESALLEGTADLAPSAERKAGVVIGAALARSIGAAVGDIVTAFSVQTAGGGSLYSSPNLAQYEVTGIYETSLANFDELYVFVDLQEAARLLDYTPGQLTRLDVRVEEGTDYTIAADRIDAMLEFPAIARPITDVYRSLFAWVRLQESIIPLVISIIVFVAAVNIIGTLLMIILEKNREMGVLASFGATASLRRRIFVRLGLFIGAAGVVIGETLALGLALLQIRFEIIPLPAEAYYMNTAPIDLSVVDFLLVAVITLALCTISSWIPAGYAARIEPIKAIQSR